MPDLKSLLTSISQTAVNSLTPGKTTGIPDVISTPTSLTEVQLTAIAQGTAKPVEAAKTTG